MRSCSLKSPTIAIALLLLASCAGPTLTIEDCQLRAWEAVGADDGRNGRDKSIIKRHRHACEKYDIEIDSSEYLRGYEQGNHTYCENYNHYAAGALGEDLPSVCNREPYISDHADGIEAYCASIDHYQVGQSGEQFDSVCSAISHQQEHARGVEYYCRHTNAYDLAREYGPYENLCDWNFNKAYELGQKSLRMEDRIENKQRELSKLIRQLIDEKEPEAAKVLREKIKVKEIELLESRKSLLRLKFEVRDLGYIRSSELIDDLAELAL